MKLIKSGDKLTLKRFIKIPQELIDDHELTNDARIIYSCLLDRASLSLKNSVNWSDDSGNVFIKFKQQDLSQRLGLSIYKVSKALHMLEKHGYLKRKRNYNNKSDTIYVLASENWIDAQSSPKHVADVHNPSSRGGKVYDRKAVEETIKSNIGYERLISDYSGSREMIQGMVKIMVNAICSNKDALIINNSSIPIDEVAEVLLSLDETHIGYVIECYSKNTTGVVNPQGYLLTSLYNAPLTIDAYYDTQVAHDLQNI